MCLNQSELKEGLRLLQRSLRFFISLFALVNLLPLNQFNQQCERISALRRPILTTNNCSDTTQFGGFIVFLATALHFQEEKKKKKKTSQFTCGWLFLPPFHPRGCFSWQGCLLCHNSSSLGPFCRCCIFEIQKKKQKTTRKTRLHGTAKSL